MRVAFFDIDGTLVDYNTEIGFAKHILWKGKISVFCLVWNFIIFIMKDIRNLTSRRVRSFKRYLRWTNAEEITRVAEKFCIANIIPKINVNVLDELKKRKKEGYKIVLMTGSLDFLLRPLKEYVKADRLIAVRIQKKDGVFTGDISGIHPYGDDKLRIIEEFCIKNNVNLSSVYSYGNHRSDIEMMKLAGHPVAVNPDRILKSYAKENNWKIIA